MSQHSTILYVWEAGAGQKEAGEEFSSPALSYSSACGHCIAHHDERACLHAATCCRAATGSGKPEQTVVIQFDPLDTRLQSFEPHFWAYLRGLRDLQGNVGFVLGARRPPSPLASEAIQNVCRELWKIIG